jgi:ribosomal protein L37AE/L43A
VIDSSDDNEDDVEEDWSPSQETSASSSSKRSTLSRELQDLVGEINNSHRHASSSTCISNRSSTRNVLPNISNNVISNNVTTPRFKRVTKSKVSPEKMPCETPEYHQVSHNVILPYEELLAFISESFVCRKCKRQTESTIVKRQEGIATSLEWQCKSCGTKTRLGAKQCNDSDATAKKPSNQKFDLNLRLVILSMLLGKGAAAAGHIGGLLDVAVGALVNDYQAIEERVSEFSMTLGKAQLKKNLTTEIECSRVKQGIVDPTAPVGLAVAGDTRWSRRSSGFAYNANSAIFVTVGMLTGKVLAIHCMSRDCNKCRQESTRDTPHVCPKNYSGSSKGMEPHGAIHCVKEIFESTGKLAYVFQFVMDDDSSCRSVLTHEKELPLEHPTITFLADKNHRIKNFAKLVFRLARLRKSERLGCTSCDAERIKKCMGYAISMYCTKDMDYFAKMCQNVVEHHFGNHSDCESLWCKAKGKSPQELADLKKFYRSKSSHPELYKQLTTWVNEFTEPEFLKMLHHGFNTNKCENMNSQFTAFMPKDQYFCSTNSEAGRAYLCVGIDSAGYETTVSELFQNLGLQMTPTTCQYLRRRDNARTRDRAYKKQFEVKARAAADRNKKIRDGTAKEREDLKRGRSYQSGMAGPFAKHQRRIVASSGSCPKCGILGHTRMTSKDCAWHKSYQNNVSLWCEHSLAKLHIEEYDGSHTCTSCTRVGHRDESSLRCWDHGAFKGDEDRWQVAMFCFAEAAEVTRGTF